MNIYEALKPFEPKTRNFKVACTICKKQMTEKQFHTHKCLNPGKTVRGPRNKK